MAACTPSPRSRGEGWGEGLGAFAEGFLTFASVLRSTLMSKPQAPHPSLSPPAGRGFARKLLAGPTQVNDMLRRRRAGEYPRCASNRLSIEAAANSHSK